MAPINSAIPRSCLLVVFLDEIKVIPPTVKPAALQHVHLIETQANPSIGVSRLRASRSVLQDELSNERKYKPILELAWLTSGHYNWTHD